MIVKWAQEDVETLYSLLNNNNFTKPAHHQGVLLHKTIAKACYRLQYTALW